MGIKWRTGWVIDFSHPHSDLRWGSHSVCYTRVRTVGSIIWVPIGGKSSFRPPLTAITGGHHFITGTCKMGIQFYAHSIRNGHRLHYTDQRPARRSAFLWFTCVRSESPSARASDILEQIDT